MRRRRRVWGKLPLAGTLSAGLLSGFASTADAQISERALGVDISYWNCGTSATGISQANWNTGFSTGNRKFVWIRATRGGTTGLSQTSGTPSPHSSQETLSRRYDDSRFLQNITRATNAGFLAGAYHFARPDIAGNTGTDEANHMIEMAGIFMRPGYMMPVFDLEAGDSTDALAQFSIDFSNRIYNVMKIRPAMYINGNHTNHLVNSGATPGSSLANQIAQPAANSPSVVGPAYPMLWNARYHPDNNDPGFNPEATIPLQTGTPKTTTTVNNSYYGPWDDYGDTDPWSFWQYGSVSSVPGFNSVDGDIDGNVSHGDIEYVRNYLVPAVWWNDSSGDWATLGNWNSGQAVTAPTQGAGQAPAFSYNAADLPDPRLPGAAGTGSNNGALDTVILERPSANITVTHSTGTTNIRKLYMRETLNITGGSLTVNYDPTYRADNLSNVRHAGPISAQFSGDVTLSGTGAFSAHTTLVDAARNFNLDGGTLTFNTLTLTRGATPAKINIGGDVTIAPLNNAAAVIGQTGSGNSAFIDLEGGTRTLTINNGTNAVDVSINIPITGVGGGLTKAGTGTLQLGAANTYSGPTTVNAGTLQAGVANALPSGTALTVNTGGTFALNNFNQAVASLAGTNGTVSLGTAALTAGGNNASTSFSGVITGGGSFTKVGTGTLTLTGANNYTGGTTVSGGTLQGNSTSLQGNIINNAAVSFDQATTGTYSGNMSGSGSLTKTGAGTLTLGGTSSYTGGTTVSAGTLRGTTSSLVGNITNNAAVTFDQSANGTYSGAISGTGSLTKTGTGTVSLSVANSYTGGTTVSQGGLQGNTTSLQGNIATVGGASVIFDQASDGTYAGNLSGNGSLVKLNAGILTLGGTNSYTGGNTVSGGTLKGTTARILGNITNNAAVVFDQTTTGTHSGNITGTGSLTKTGVGAVTLNGTNTYTGGTTVSAGLLQGSTNSLQGNIINNAGVTFSQGSDGTYAGTMSGSGALTKNGAGILTLSGPNSYTGGTTVATGILRATTASLPGNVNLTSGTLNFDQATNGTFPGIISGATGGVIKSGSGTVILTGTNSFGSATVSGGVLQGNTASLPGHINNSAAVVFDQTTDGTFTFTVNGSGSLTKTGAGTLTFTNFNTYTGGTTVSAGTLRGTSSTIPGDVVNNANLEFDQTSGFPFNGVISGTGSLTKSGTGHLTLTAANTYSGGSTVNAGALRGTTTSLQGNITNNALVSFDQATDGTYAGNMTGTGQLQKTNTGVVTLTGAHSYTGGNTVSGGTLASVNGFKNGGPMTIAFGAKAVVPESAPSVYNPPAMVPAGANAAGSKVGSLTINGTGQLDLNNNDMVVDHDGSLDISDIRDLIGSGYNFGSQDGPGIISTTAALTDPFTFTLGYADNASLPLPYGTVLGGGLFADQDPDDTAALIKFTWVGDVTLDGVLDFQDLSIFNGNYDSGATTGRVWTEGDLNYDGTIDFQDLSLFNGTYDPSKPSLPEPGGLAALLAFAAAAPLRRRRRRQR